MISQEYLKSVLSYDPDSGVFTWIGKTGSSANSFIGKEAGCIARKKNYSVRLIRVNKRLYRAHVLAWLYVYGEYPANQIDHIDGNPLNNRIDNLRDVPQTTNMQNLKSSRRDNKLGLLGVHMRRDGKYIAQITANGVAKFIGVFGNENDAHQAYINEKRRLHQGCTI